MYGNTLLEIVKIFHIQLYVYLYVISNPSIVIIVTMHLCYIETVMTLEGIEICQTVFTRFNIIPLQRKTHYMILPRKH